MYLPSVNIQHVEWSEAAPKLARALADYASEAGQEVKSGKAFAFKVGKAYALLRAEGSELVVVGYEGDHTLKEGAPVIAKFAKKMGAKTIRVHTQRRGELRFLNSIGLGFQLAEQRPDEFVLRLHL